MTLTMTLTDSGESTEIEIADNVVNSPDVTAQSRCLMSALRVLKQRLEEAK